MRVWQIVTGQSGRDYRELFFDHDIMIIGHTNAVSTLVGLQPSAVEARRVAYGSAGRAQAPVVAEPWFQWRRHGRMTKGD